MTEGPKTDPRLTPCGKVSVLGSVHAIRPPPRLFKTCAMFVVDSFLAMAKYAVSKVIE